MTTERTTPDAAELERIKKLARRAEDVWFYDSRGMIGKVDAAEIVALCFRASAADTSKTSVGMKTTTGAGPFAMQVAALRRSNDRMHQEAADTIETLYDAYRAAQSAGLAWMNIAESSKANEDEAPAFRCAQDADGSWSCVVKLGVQTVLIDIDNDGVGCAAYKDGKFYAMEFPKPEPPSVAANVSESGEAKCLCQVRDAQICGMRKGFGPRPCQCECHREPTPAPVSSNVSESGEAAKLMQTQCVNVRCNACDRSLVGVGCCDRRCDEAGADCGLRPLLNAHIAPAPAPASSNMSESGEAQRCEHGFLMCGLCGYPPTPVPASGGEGVTDTDRLNAMIAYQWKIAYVHGSEPVRYVAWKTAEADIVEESNTFRSFYDPRDAIDDALASCARLTGNRKIY